MITAKLVKVYGHKRESFDFGKAECISVAPDSKEVRITYSGQEHLITVKDGGSIYINVYGILVNKIYFGHKTSFYNGNIAKQECHFMSITNPYVKFGLHRGGKWRNWTNFNDFSN